LYRIDGAKIEDNITRIGRARSGGILFRERICVGARSRLARESDASVGRIAGTVTGWDNMDSILNEWVAVDGREIPVITACEGILVLENAWLTLLGDLEDCAGTKAVRVYLEWQTLGLTSHEMDGR
jgi:hypothetical protein